MSGSAFTKLPDALSFVEWAKNHPDIAKEIYFCTSLQEKAELKPNGNLKALRTTNNALAFRAIWLEIDCNKEPPKGYRSKEEGLQAVIDFCDKTQTPYPNAIIDSGNGLHVYWISDKLLTKAEWLPYAEGLHALATEHGLMHDAVTTDAARVLRVPGTSNNKQVPAKPVVIKLLEADLSFASELKHLLAVKPTAKTSQTPREIDLTSLFLNQKEIEKGPPSFKFPADAIWKLEEYDARLLPFEPVQEGCPFFADAYNSHGKEHSQPLWHLVALATTFLQDGEQLLHDLGNAHPGYSHDSTQAMWERKVKDREERGIGWVAKRSKKQAQPSVRLARNEAKSFHPCTLPNTTAATVPITRRQTNHYQPPTMPPQATRRDQSAAKRHRRHHGAMHRYPHPRAPGTAQGCQ
jgi:hypothetical protein